MTGLSRRGFFKMLGGVAGLLVTSKIPFVAPIAKTLHGNYIEGIGTGSNNNSIWLIMWKDEKLVGFFPKGKT